MTVISLNIEGMSSAKEENSDEEARVGEKNNST